MSDKPIWTNLCPISLPLSVSSPDYPSCHLTRERMKLPFMNDQCEQMLKICNEFVRLQVSYEEYLCMKVLLLLSTGITVQLSLNSGAPSRLHNSTNYYCVILWFGCPSNVKAVSFIFF